MSLMSGQPKMRFAGHYNPGNIAGISYEPKVLTIRKTITKAESGEAVWTAPAGTYVTRVFGVCTEVSASTDAAASFGLHDNLDAFLDPTEMLLDTTTRFATNIGSTTANFPNGYYFPAADVVSLAITGSTVTNGQVEIVVEFYELGEMFITSGIHVDL